MTAPEKYLGICFGTALCRAAWVTGRAGAATLTEGANRTPAAFYAGPAGPVVGAGALDRLRDPAARPHVHTGVARDLGKELLHPLGDREYAPGEIAERILAAARVAAEREAGGGFTRAAVAYPVWFDAVARDALQAAATAAGLPGVTLLTQAEATAAAFLQCGRELGERILVVDVGAASTDLSVLARESVGAYAAATPARSLPVGGDDLDLALYAHVAAAAERQAGRPVFAPGAVDLAALHACRRVKEALSLADAATFEYTGPSGPVRVAVGRADLEAVARPKLEEVVRAAAEALAGAADRGRPVGTVLVTGGGVLMPLVPQLLRGGLPGATVLVDERGPSAAAGAAWAAAGTPAKRQPPLARPAPEEATPEFKAAVDAVRAKFEEAKSRPFRFMLVGRAGVGKSSTLNSLFGWQVAAINAYERQTDRVTVYSLDSGGVNFKIIDTPGLCDDDPSAGNDLRYLEDMRVTAGEIDALWYVTQLDDERVRSDELRTIRLITEAFGADIWRHAVVVFTRADMVPAADYPEALAMRKMLLHRAIAKYATEDVAKQVPAVAVSNVAPLTPDGKKWKGELYTETFLAVKKESVIRWGLGTLPLTRPAAPPKEDRPEPARRERPERGERGPPREEPQPAHIELPPPQARRIGERLQRETFGSYVSAGAAGGAAVGMLVGGPVGAVIGGALGAVGGAVTSWFRSWFG